LKNLCHGKYLIWIFFPGFARILGKMCVYTVGKEMIYGLAIYNNSRASIFFSVKNWKKLRILMSAGGERFFSANTFVKSVFDWWKFTVLWMMGMTSVKSREYSLVGNWNKTTMLDEILWYRILHESYTKLNKAKRN
jgi:hypothetical protein